MPASSVTTCRNCGTPAPGNYCPVCGQETATDSQTTAQFFHGLVRQWATPDGVLWQTLSRLLFVPGALTTEYAAGRRARYLRPMQLYLAAGLVVFAAVQFFSLDASVRFYGERGIHLLRASPLSADARAGGTIRMTPVDVIVDHIDTGGVRRFKAMSGEERFRFLHAKRAQSLSYFVLVLVPLFALILNVCYCDRRRPYGTHLVFGLHTHTFLLLMLLVEGMLPTVFANVMSLWVMTYFVVALRRVYTGSWAETVVRESCVPALYFAVWYMANVLLIFGLLEL
jgi:Protein of unknown function (DUF3667)